MTKSNKSKESLDKPKRSLSRKARRTVLKTKKIVKTYTSPSFGTRVNRACETTRKYNIFSGGVCATCVTDMPKEISSIRYLTDVDFVDKLNKACKNDKLHAYCDACKQSLIVNKSNIALFSSKDFEKAL